MLEMPEHQEEMQCTPKFGKMKSLRMLIIEKKDSFLRSPATLPNSMRVLEWRGYPATSLQESCHTQLVTQLLWMGQTTTEFKGFETLDSQRL
ncbi:hypothetical protein VIGAN_11205900 [Vigna angularis var. angularis]|uniref:Uncharacterized protein n=1 Tax=Vigna angularis var. angularis TaxID=157739 RepID=A0A0S3TC17_PHAAN|nr:hypothetical protein VIGAN_11205900 [Vigna angularis var. angularis]